VEDLWLVVRSIPKGKVAAYGEVGRALKNPTSGFLVGRWMARCPKDIPWWRVVSKEGLLPVWKKDPDAERRQIELLEAEGVEVVDGQVSMEKFAIYL
jgi:methylated-DNA-protein-cysteine methyltransferase-like protein